MELTRNVVAAVLALSLAGCSLFMKTNAEGWEPRLAPTCSDSKSAPLIDTIAAGVGVVVAGYGIGCQTRDDFGLSGERCTMFALAPGITTALVFGIPALVGWLRVSKCREVKRKHEGWLRPDPSDAEKP